MQTIVQFIKLVTTLMKIQTSVEFLQQVTIQLANQFVICLASGDIFKCANHSKIYVTSRNPI